MKPSAAKFRILAVLLLAGILPAMVNLAAHLLLGDVQHVQGPLHEWFELTGTCIALGVAMLLLLRARHQQVDPHLLWVVAALVAMGLVDGAHAVAPFGVAWSWLRHGATLVGGVLFAMVWLPPPAVAVRRNRLFILTVAALALTGALAVWRWAEWLPAPFLPAGYSIGVKLANAMGGLGFLAAAGFFIRRYLRQPQNEELVFASHTLLFGTASLLFGYSQVWAADWWVWHVARLAAYAVVLIAAYEIVTALYQEIARQAQELEGRVEARTTQLRQSEERLRQSADELQAANAELRESRRAALNLMDDAVAAKQRTEQVSEALRQSQHRLAAAMEIAALSVWEYRQDTALIEFDQRSSEMFGTGNQRAMTIEQFLAFVHQEDRQRVAADVSGALDPAGDGLYDTEYRIVRPDGVQRWLAARGHAIFTSDGRGRRLVRAVGTVMDVTERKQAEEALRDSEQRLARSQEIAHLGSWELDLINDRLTWSDEVYRIFGLQPQEFAATYEAFLEHVHPDDRAAVDAAYFGSIREGRDTYEIEHRVVRKHTGEIRTVHEKCEHFRDADGKVIRSVGMIHDITEQKLTAEHIEAMARFPSENPFPVLRIASDGTILYSNGPGMALLEQWKRQADEKMPPDWCKHVAHALNTGRNAVREMKCGQRILSLVLAPVVQDAYVNLYGRDITKERKAEVALRRAHADLERKVQQRTAELVQTVGFLREEVEQRTQAQEAVKAERQRFNDVLETLPAYVCLLTPDYYMPFANRVFREWFGYYPDKKCHEFLFNRTEPCETCETFTVLKTNKSHHWEWTGPNGRNYDVFDFPFKDTDGSQLILEMGIDITDLKQAEKAVRSSEERYRSLTVATTQVVWTTDAEGQVVGDLPSWRAFTGQSEQEMRGWGWIESLHPDDRDRTAEIWSRALRDRALYQTEYRLRRHDGQYRHVAVRGVPVIQPDGRIREWVGTCTDTTEKKAAEEELEKYRMHLEDLVKQRTQELAHSNKDLEQFAYVASHDLQEPLRAVAGFVELLKRNLQNSLDAKTTKYMGFTIDGVMRMQALINGLLEYSRIGTRGKQPKRIDAGAALERAMANLQTSIKESGAEITAASLPIVYFDDMQLCQLFQNLIGNAIKFRAEQAPRVHISASRLDDSWRFAVEDNGIGIDPQYAERIFLIFQRLHSREEYPGTGIGLSICKKIVERHNGKIWVESAPGRGSTFYFTIPV